MRRVALLIALSLVAFVVLIYVVQLIRQRAA